MFNGSLLSTAALAAAAAGFMSPSKSGKVKVNSTRYRNDPYAVRVTAKTPVVQQSAPLLQMYAAPASPQRVAAAAPMPQQLAAATAAPVQHWARIQFKRETAWYMAPFRIDVGDRVVVQADRGENYGTVADISSVKPDFNVPSAVIRRSTVYDDEVKMSLMDREDPTTAAIQRTSESLGLGIRVVDTEFQLDGNKLTIFFSSRVFVDFRKLQRSLFREFRTRIWLVNANEIRTDVQRLC